MLAHLFEENCKLKTELKNQSQLANDQLAEENFNLKRQLQDEINDSILSKRSSEEKGDNLINELKELNDNIFF